MRAVGLPYQFERARDPGVRELSERFALTRPKNYSRRDLEKLPNPGVTIEQLWGAGRASIDEADRGELSELGYKQASLIYACVRELATSAAEAPLVVERGGALVDSKRDLLAELVLEPNDEYSQVRFIEETYTDLYGIHGETFIRLIRSRGDIVRELWPMRPEHMDVVPAKDGTVLRYDYNGKAIAPRDVIHCKLPNPTDPFRGLSPIYVLQVEGEMDRNAVKFLAAFFKNGGIPGFALSIPNDSPPPALIEFLKDRVRETVGRRGGNGNEGWHEPLILGGSATIQPVGVDLAQLDLPGIFSASESRICAVYGVPAMLVGAKVGLDQSSQYGTSAQAGKWFWQNTMIPSFRSYSAWLTHLLARREFGREYRIRFDLSKVGALAEDPTDMRRDAIALFGAGLWTRNRALQFIGDEPADKGDVYVHDLQQGAQGALTA